MFSGIVEEVGRVVLMRKIEDIVKLSVEVKKIDAKIGDSIAVDGVCLTVTNISNGIFDFDLSPETIERTTLKFLKEGMPVNLQPALKMGDRIGGHIVLGHVDCIGTICMQKIQGKSRIIGIKPSEDFKGLVIRKGSVAIDGISLTVVDSFDTYFTISLIPHTIENTTLKYKKVGSWVNIEFDYIAKIVKENLR
ncbi:riboflavin synthase [Anaerocellum diazotrophicum]|uniref:Riboflavin synthase n=1 Tax=Caldicellulosiruptor diazotrophicus TaxID=2806205 RepID=A0ABM7NPA9_9FIRM|nr:riboflavin synthase [Caldicellulosiruptor diazotrophicus]BCS81928.1 riboflavin synthase [Caldicellulosiruptor diazotrophicus]